MISSHQLFTNIRTELRTIYDADEASELAFMLLRHVGNVTKPAVLAGQPVPDEMSIRVQPLVHRLVQHEPIQYVLGETGFFGKRFLVNPSVLIPRPETEELVAWIVEENRHETGLRMVDVGTGSGCIAVSLAGALPHAQVTAIDVSAAALETARKNAEINQTTVQFILADVLQPEWTEKMAANALDILVSNPPYVTRAEQALMRPNVTEFEPHVALFVTNDDPLIFYRRLAESGHRLLKNGGACYVETNENYAQPVAALFRTNGFAAAEVKQDMFGKNRFVRAAR